MKYHLERSTILNNETEFKNLYAWCLQEKGEAGNKLGRDLIPWGWRARFQVVELAITDRLSNDVSLVNDNGDQPSIDADPLIRGKLVPAEDFVGRGATRYSMFGTDRVIPNIDLTVRRLNSGEDDEYCQAWGFCSYTTDIDFRDETEPDCLGFYLFLRPQNFARVLAVLESSCELEGSLTLDTVSGFYSDWSPSISTNLIKVLTKTAEHVVEIPSGCEIDPPRLGKVHEFELTLTRGRRLFPAAGDEAHQEEEEEEREPRGRYLPRLEAPRPAQTGTGPDIIRILGAIRGLAVASTLLLLILAVKACS